MSVRVAKGGKGNGNGNADPLVNGVVPDTASQGVTLDIEVDGSGFDASADVALGVSGNPVSTVTTNSTTFLSASKLRANITIAPEADTSRYDVIVAMSKGRKGIGTTLFKVKKGQGPWPQDIAVEGLVEDQSIDFSAQGLSGSVAPAITSDNGAIYPGQVTFPVPDPMGRLVLDSGSGNGKSTRSYCLDLGDASNIRLAAGASLPDWWPSACFKGMSLFTATRSGEGAPLDEAFVDLEVGEVGYQGGRFYAADKQSSWWLTMDPWSYCHGENAADGQPVLDGTQHARGQGIRVERLPDTPDGRRVWLVQSQVDAAGRFSAELNTAGKRTGRLCVGKIYNAPFSITVTEQP